MWRPQIEPLSERLRLIVPDIRGLGQSSAGPLPPLIEFFVDDMIALLDRLGIKRAIWCGLSIGGYIALRGIQRNPERFQGLILCDTRSDPDSDEVKLKRAAHIRLIHEQGLESYADSFLKTLLGPDTQRSRPERVQALKEMILASKPDSICSILPAMAARTDTTPVLTRIQIPTLVITGDQDAQVHLEAARHLHELIRDSELKIISGAGHFSNLENPEEFNASVEDFLSRRIANAKAA